MRDAARESAKDRLKFYRRLARHSSGGRPLNLNVCSTNGTIYIFQSAGINNYGQRGIPSWKISARIITLIAVHDRLSRCRQAARDPVRYPRTISTRGKGRRKEEEKRGDMLQTAVDLVTRYRCGQRRTGSAA